MSKIFFVVIFCFLSSMVCAQTANTNGGISLIPKPTEDEIKNSHSLAPIPSNVKIPQAWVGLLNPAYEEFWTEGNHKPDAGFILFARNPTKENAKLWLIRNEIKANYAKIMMNSILEAQRELVRDGAIKDRYNMVNPPTKNNKKKNNVSAVDNKLSRDIGVYFLFSPKCSYCHNLASNLKTLNNVQPLQVTKDELFNFDGLPESDYASPETVKSYAPDGAVPVLVLIDNKSKKASLIKGYRSQDEVVSLISKFQKEVL